jgi:hypothetical protein
MTLLLEIVKKSLADLRRSGWSGDVHAGAGLRVDCVTKRYAAQQGQQQNAFYAM